MIDPFSLVFFFWSIQELAIPQPTQDQIALIQKMGDDSFDAREQAQQELEKQNSILAIERYGLTHQDIEVRHRSQDILNNLYSITSTKGEIPPCIGLFAIGKIRLDKDREITIPVGTAKYWFEYIGGTYNYDNNAGNSHEAKVEQTKLATTAFIQHLRRNGYSVEDIKTILDAVERHYSIYPLQWYDLYYIDEATSQRNPYNDEP